LTLFRPARCHETNLRATKPFFAFGGDIRKQRTVIAPATTADNAGNKTGDRQMRTLSFILAFAFVLGGSSLAGTSDGSLPGVGTFAYNGSPQAFVMAVR
jgi:hypothetical protein